METQEAEAWEREFKKQMNNYKKKVKTNSGNQIINPGLKTNFNAALKAANIALGRTANANATSKKTTAMQKLANSTRNKLQSVKKNANSKSRDFEIIEPFEYLIDKNKNVNKLIGKAKELFDNVKKQRDDLWNAKDQDQDITQLPIKYKSPPWRSDDKGKYYYVIGNKDYEIIEVR